MKVLFSHWTALALYRRGWVLQGSADAPLADFGDPEDPWKTTPGGKAANRALVRGLASCGCVAPIHTLVPAGTSRSSAQGFAPHALPRSLVEASVRRTTLPDAEELKELEAYVVSPELLFAELARPLGEAGAALFGMELCGRYLKSDPGDPRTQIAQAGFSSLAQPLTAPESLKTFLAQQPPYVEGARAALNVLPHVAAGARSPMEASIFLGMTLPQRLGGYYIDKPEINVKVQLDERVGRVLSDADLEWDFGWLEPPMMDLEYQSLQFHTLERRTRDDRRRNELASDGVISLAWGPADVLDSEAFKKNCVNIAQLRGRPFRTELRDFEQRYQRLHSFLFGSDPGEGAQMCAA